MGKLIKILKDRCDKGLPSMLVTIVGGSGSSPRGAGAHMAVGEEGRLAGTIGGGMLEFKATESACFYLKNGEDKLVSYGLTNETAAGLGMVCGGKVDILFTYLPPVPAVRDALEQMGSCLSCQIPGWLILPLKGRIGFLGEEGKLAGLEKAPKIPSDMDKPGILEYGKEKYYIQKIQNTSRVYVFGGGHLAQELVPLLSHLGFRCIVTDDRAEYSSKNLFPDAEEVRTLSYDELYGKFDIQPQDYIIAVTRGHMGDFEVQRFALKTPAYYIGAVGSRSKIAAVNQKLRENGFTDEDISRITAPIGLPIKSEPPAEIAVSIAAQLIEKRADYTG